MYLHWPLIICTVLVSMVVSRKPRLIDLTHELSPDFPVHPFYSRLNFTILLRKQFPTHWLEFNYIGTDEHVGTHMDAPSHLRRRRGGKRVHQIPLERFIGPGVVLRVADKVAINQVYQVSVDDILEWEAKYGQIPQGAIVMIDAGWTHRVHSAKLMFGTETPDIVATFRTPSISVAAAQFLVRRNISVVGADTFSVDPGNAIIYPTHLALLPRDIIILENVANLDQVPEAGSRIYCMPLNLRDGSGSPIRAFAVIDDDVTFSTGSISRCVSMFYLSILGVATVASHIMLLLC